MPRPNHDLPNLLLGGIKDYARREDATQDEAHADLLARGLREVEIINCIEKHSVSRSIDTDESSETKSQTGKRDKNR